MSSIQSNTDTKEQRFCSLRTSHENMQISSSTKELKPLKHRRAMPIFQEDESVQQIDKDYQEHLYPHHSGLTTNRFGQGKQFSTFNNKKKDLYKGVFSSLYTIDNLHQRTNSQEFEVSAKDKRQHNLELIGNQQARIKA